MCSHLDPVFDPRPSNDHASASRLGTTVFACQSSTHACPSDPPLDIHPCSCLPNQVPCLSDTAVFNKALLSSWTWSGFSVWHSWQNNLATNGTSGSGGDSPSGRSSGATSGRDRRTSIRAWRPCALTYSISSNELCCRWPPSPLHRRLLE